MVIPTPLAAWNFTESSPPYLSTAGDLPLALGAGSVTSVTDVDKGPAINCGGGHLKLLAASVGRLNIGGNGGTQVSVSAWVKRTTTAQGFIAGCWQEDEADPRRQYGMFVDLPLYGGAEMAVMHISKTGAPTPGWPYSIDYSANPVVVTNDVWQFHVGTYDGADITSYLDGVATVRTGYSPTKYDDGRKNPYTFPDGLNATPSDFTIGQVKLSSGMGNTFQGRIAQLRVWDVALTPTQITELYEGGEIEPPPDPGRSIIRGGVPVAATASVIRNGAPAPVA